MDTSTLMNNNNKYVPKVVPYYQLIDGKRFRAVFVRENYLSALEYKARPEDVFVVGYYKSGTTWTQQIVHLLFNEGKAPANYHEFNQRTPYLEMFGADTVQKMKIKGAIKTHFTYSLQPFHPQAKYIYVARNPKDVCVSFYHHTHNIPAYRFEEGTFDDFFELFINGETECGDYFEHVLSWFEHMNDPNVLFMTYEEIKADEVKGIKKIAAFLGSKYLDMVETQPKIFEDILKNSNITHMKKQMNDTMAEMYSGSVGDMLTDDNVSHGMKLYFESVAEEAKIMGTGVGGTKKVEWIRKGVVNDWRNHFSPEQDARLKAEFERRTKGTGLASLWKNVNWW